MKDRAAGRPSIDLNADLGEWDSATTEAARIREADERLMEFVTSVNVACGGHRGDPDSMRGSVLAALARGVAIGAHPSFPDRAGFGRRPLAMAPAALRHAVAGQVAALAAVVAAAGGALRHVKPHGALYNLAADDEGIAASVVLAVADVDRGLVVVGRSGGALVDVARRHGLRAAAEVFCDRGYDGAGRLLPRGEPGALIDDPHLAAMRLVRMVREGRVTAQDGTDVTVVADTACIHGDTPGAVEVAGCVRAALASAGVSVAAIVAPN